MKPNYRITFTRVGSDSKEVIELLKREEVGVMLTQLKRLSTSMKGNIILGIEQLSYLKIEVANFETQDGIDYFGNGGELLECDIIDVEKKYIDITNNLLLEYEIKGDDYIKMGKVLFDNNLLTVNGYDFLLEGGKKIAELFDLLFRSKTYYKKMEFTYDELKDVYKNSGVKYNLLLARDLNRGSIEDIVGKKLNTIKKKTGIKEKILIIEANKISIRQETA